MYSVMSVDIDPNTHQVVKATVVSLEKEFKLTGQFYNCIDALSLAPIIKPDIIFLKEHMLFVGVQQFIRTLALRGLQTRYIILSETSQSQ